MFIPRGDQSRSAGIATPTRLFASEVGPHSHSRRPLETLQPLSERLGMPLDDPVLQDEVDQLVKLILACEGNVLVAWEHKRIPFIANRLVGDATTVPQTWPDDRFDVVWIFEPGLSAGGWHLRQVPQLLLAGDRAEPIG